MSSSPRPALVLVRATRRNVITIRLTEQVTAVIAIALLSNPSELTMMNQDCMSEKA